MFCQILKHIIVLQSKHQFGAGTGMDRIQGNRKKTRSPMNLMCNKNWHFNTVGEKTTYSTNGATSPLDEGRWSGEEPNLISYTIKNVR